MSLTKYAEKSEKEKLEALLRKVGYKKPKKRQNLKSNWDSSFLRIENSRNVAPLSNNIHVTGGYKKDVSDYKWKRDREETKETIAEIEKKSKRIAPAYSKGAYQYVTDETDPTTLGRKI